MCSKCSAVNYHTVLLAFALTVSPTASPKSSEKRASSRRPENGQRLAGNVGNPEIEFGCSISFEIRRDPGTIAKVAKRTTSPDRRLFGEWPPVLLQRG